MDIEVDSGSYSSSQDSSDSYLLVQRRHELTRQLYDSPYDLILYLRRAVIHSTLGYPDLAAGDAYRALLLTDEVLNEEFEYHQQATDSLLRHTLEPLPDVLHHGDLGVASLAPIAPPAEADTPNEKLAKIAAIRCHQILAISLCLCRCLKTAHRFCERGLALSADNPDLLNTSLNIRQLAMRRTSANTFDAATIPDKGIARREVYPWNVVEPDRFSSSTLDFLNEKLEAMAPKCEIKATELPALLDTANETDHHQNISSTRQLGVFAKEDIQPGEDVLQEYTLLTANNRHKESTCDACGDVLPPLGSQSTAINCQTCHDTVFCCEICHDLAQQAYHPALCDKDVDSIAKEPDPADVDESLYFLLLVRILAMSTRQQTHPLELEQIKYIWGDFAETSFNNIDLSPTAGPPPDWTLPFSFQYHIEMPLHVLEKMDVNIWTTLPRFDLWVLNTCFAKFRGTASARKSNRDGRPEVAAVHPYWCLANHSCDPNVTWEWSGRMRLWAKEQRVLPTNRPGIRAGEEVLNHYCDITLPVNERREWAKGALGGICMCERCWRESDTRRNGNDTHMHDASASS